MGSHATPLGHFVLSKYFGALKLCGIEDCDIHYHLLDFGKIDENQDTPLCDAPDQRY